MNHPAKVIAFPVESPTERAAHSLAVAIDDADAALWQANTLAEIEFARHLIEGAIQRLTIAATVAQTRMEFPQ
jgi:hypothetical protein